MTIPRSFFPEQGVLVFKHSLFLQDQRKPLLASSSPLVFLFSSCSNSACGLFPFFLYYAPILSTMRVNCISSPLCSSLILFSLLTWPPVSCWRCLRRDLPRNLQATILESPPKNHVCGLFKRIPPTWSIHRCFFFQRLFSSHFGSPFPKDLTYWAYFSLENSYLDSSFQNMQFVSSCKI